ncbi:MAG: glycerol-3-phosphate 1-O-acyltransferase PlsY [Metamycoplasmataceae bacterium]
MNAEDAIWINLIFIIIGYLIGSLNFSLLITTFNKKFQNIKSVGSGNAGATNALRSYGWKFGLLVFFLDVSKAYWFAFILGIIESQTIFVGLLYPQVATIFVVIGHIFPIFFKFKGGKGASCVLGLVASISLLLAGIGAIIFFSIVLTSKYVSLGSIISPVILSFLTFIPYLTNFYDSTIHIGESWLYFLSIFISSMFVIYSHKINIKNLILKQERKINFKS